MNRFLTSWARTAMTLLALFLFFGGARAQKALPYEYGFENNDLAAEGWTTVDKASSTAISNLAKYSGTYSFMFSFNTTPPQFLISPEFDGTSAMTVSFWYKIYSAGYPESFQVGYSTTTSETDAFTWETEVTATNDSEWLQYETNFPAGTKFVAVRYNSNDMYRLFLDDFSFTVPAAVAKPTGLAYTLTPGDGTVATLSWTQSDDATAWEICLNDDEANLISATTNPFTLTGLTPETTYTAKVRAIKGSDKSAWSTSVTFTPTNAFSLTVNDGTTTNNYVPVYGMYVDEGIGSQSQFIIPAADLATIAYGNIEKLTFYAADDKSWGAAEFEVYVTEVADATFATATLVDWSTMNLVKNATALAVSDGKMEITLDNTYQYMGGNLLIGIHQTTLGTYKSVSWYGVTATGASLNGYKADAISQRNFLPKTTIDYTPGVAPTCAKPTGLALVGEPTYNSAQLTWTAGESSQDTWQICINDDEANLITVNTTTYTMTCTEATAYSVKVRAYCSASDQSAWSNTVSFTTPEQFPKPTDLAVDYNEWTNSSVKLTWTENGTATAWVVAYKAETDADFTEVNASENPFTLTGLADGTLYSIKVRAKYDGGQSAWSDAISVRTDYCPDVDKCYITYELKVTSGYEQYGWYGAYLLVVDDETGDLIDYWTVPQNATNGTFTGSLAVCSGRALTFQWYTQNASNDAILIGDIVVKDANGEDIINTTGALTADVNYVVDCTISEFKKPTNLTASQIGPNSAVLSWTENGTATAWVVEVTDNDEAETTEVDASTNPYTLTGLTAETEYWVKVRPAGANTKWSEGVLFTTTVDCPVPTDVAVTPQPTTAEVTWTGFGESYNVRYRKCTPGEVILSEDFESGIGSWTTSNSESDSKVYTDAGMDGGAGFAFKYTTNPPQYLISPELIGVVEGSKLSFYYANYQAGYPESFKVGYSTTTNDVDNDFTWTKEITVGADTDWHLYEQTLPAGVTYISIQCTSYDKYYMFVDNVSIIGPITSTEEWTITTTTETSIELTSLNPETMYEVQVQAVKGKEKSDWTASTTFTTLENNPVPTNIVADVKADGATLTWEGIGESYNLKYRTAGSEEVFFYEDFENGLPDTWTTIDADGDGNNWYFTNTDGTNALSGSGVMTSASSVNSGSGWVAVQPDNWLVTPQLDLQGAMRVWVRSQNSSDLYLADHFAIYLSTTGTDVDDFTVTLVDEVTELTTSYVAYTADLSAYAGQKGYIAIRHFNSDDQFRINIDDFGIYGATTSASAWQDMAVTDPTATLSGLATNNGYEYQIQSVKGGETSDWSDVGEFALLTLGNDATDITSLIVNNVGRQAHVTLSGRTLFKDGYWNTICLPFDIDDTDATVLADATIKTLTAADVTGTAVEMSFTEYPIYAGIPYVIKWASGTDIVNPAFANVTISATQGYSLNYAEGKVKFIGYYDAFPITAADANIYYMTADNKLKHTGANRTLKSLRAYFWFSDALVSGTSPVREIILDFGDGTITTSIDQIEDGRLKMDDSVYDLQGRKVDVQNGQLRKGIYIVNGQKKVVRSEGLTR